MRRRPIRNRGEEQPDARPKRVLVLSRVFGPHPGPDLRIRLAPEVRRYEPHVE